jgi:hypothetical protein
VHTDELVRSLCHAPCHHATMPPCARTSARADAEWRAEWCYAELNVLYECAVLRVLYEWCYDKWCYDKLCCDKCCAECAE